MPLAPAIPFGRFDPRPVVHLNDVRQSTSTKRTCIALVDMPGVQLQLSDIFQHHRVISETKGNPFLDDGFGTEIGIPGQAREAIEIGHR